MSGSRPSGGEAGRTVPEAPALPDAAPEAVQNLLNGLFDGLDSAAGGLGDVVSGLAEAIGGSAGMVVDLAGVLL
jgi:phage-related protein